MPDKQAIRPSLEMEEFWSWLGAHYNCILRAGGLDFTVFDQPDVHWRLGVDPDGTCFVQLIRGKEATAEFFISTSEILYVQAVPEEGEHTRFELVGEIDGNPVPVCHFLLTHPYDEENAPSARTWTH